MATLLFRRKGDQITKVTTTGSGLTTVVPNSGGFLYYYQTGTTTLQTTFADAAGTTPNTNPLELDSDGRLQTSVYFGDSGSYVNYRENLTDSSGSSVSTLWPIDDLACASPVVAATTVFASPYVPWMQKTSAASPVTLTASDAGAAFESDTTGGSITYNLPSAASVGVGKGFWFHKIVGANSQIWHPSGTESINSVNADYTVTRRNAVHFITSNGAGWDITTASYRMPPVTRCSVDNLISTNNAAIPTTRWDVTATDAVLMDADGDYIRTGPISLTIDATKTGVNALDTGTLTVATCYHVWLISNGTTTSAIKSLSYTSPALPSGYTYKYRIGAVLTDSSVANFERIIQRGSKSSYKVVPGSTTPTFPLLVNGVLGSTAVPTWVAVDMTAFIPTTAVEAKVFGNAYNTDEIILAPNNNFDVGTSTTNPPPYYLNMNTSVGAAILFEYIIENSMATALYAATNSANARVWLYGWTDSVNAS